MLLLHSSIMLNMGIRTLVRLRIYQRRRQSASRYLSDRRWQQVLAYGQERAKALGITEADVPRLIAEISARAVARLVLSTGGLVCSRPGLTLRYHGTGYGKGAGPRATAVAEGGHTSQ